VTLDLTHLPKGIRERAFDGSHDRIRQVRAANWVGYARATRALDRLEELIEQPSCARMPCLLLYGESGMGKTMIVEKFQRLHPPTFDRGSGVEHRPVVIVQMPSGPDDRRFFTRILHELGVPYSSHWRVGALERAALDALTLARTQVLIVEEVHQLLAGSAREQRLSLNLIKSIANDLRICTVAVGTGEARHAFEADPQIRRRFDPFSLPRWTECDDFRDFVCAFGKLYPLRKSSSLGERGIVQKILQASEGITGPVTRVLSLAAVEAIRTSTEFIDEAGIEAAAARLRQDLT
jgi:type II secretory pathway predicted ATPase ExeA